MINQNESEIYENYRICQKCGSKVLASYSFCTHCGSQMEESISNTSIISPQSIESDVAVETLNVIPETKSTKKSPKGLKISVIILAVLLCASIAGNVYEFITLQDKTELLTQSQDELKTAQSKITSLQKKVDEYEPKADYYDEICSFLKGSDAGYASGNFKCSDKIVYLKRGGNTKNVTITTGYTATYSWYNIGNSASGDFKYNSWSGNSTTFIFTSSLFSDGITVFTFTNSVNSQSFRVMVIVE